MVVHLGLATVLASMPRWNGLLGKMRLTPIAKKLQQSLTERDLPEPLAG